jgi:hypothetical protein
MLDRSGPTWILNLPDSITKNGRKGRTGAPILAFDRTWRNALRAAKLPPGRIFHDLRRSAVRNLIRAGVDPSETAAALALADAYLSAQPKVRNVEEGQFGDSRAVVGAQVVSSQQRLAEAGGSRTHRCGDQPAAGRL